jgi:hypothetical protein
MRKKGEIWRFIELIGGEERKGKERKGEARLGRGRKERKILYPIRPSRSQCCPCPQGDGRRRLKAQDPLPEIKTRRSHVSPCVRPTDGAHFPFPEFIF